jgi:hypothetical protein
MIVSGAPGAPTGAPGGVPTLGPASFPAVAGRLGAAEGAGAGERNALRSTAPRVKIDGVVRGSLMVT